MGEAGERDRAGDHSTPFIGAGVRVWGGAEHSTPTIGQGGTIPACRSPGHGPGLNMIISIREMIISILEMIITKLLR